MMLTDQDEGNQKPRPKGRLLTYLSILHGSDVRPQPTVRLGNYTLHLLVYFIQNHCEAGKIIHLKHKQAIKKTPTKTKQEALKEGI